MTIRDPIPLLAKWRDSKAGAWTKRHIRTSNHFGLILGVFCLLPFGFAILVSDKFWGTATFISGVIICLLLVILINSAHEEPPHASPLTVQQKQEIIKSLKLKSRSQDASK